MGKLYINKCDLCNHLLHSLFSHAVLVPNPDEFYKTCMIILSYFRRLFNLRKTNPGSPVVSHWPRLRGRGL